MSIDANTASQETLIAITGIHVQLVDAIIRARPFNSIDELRSIAGIGRRNLRQLKEQGLIVRGMEPPRDALAQQPEPYLVQATVGFEPHREIKVGRSRNPRPLGTLGDLGLAVRVTGPPEFQETILIQPFGIRRLTGIDPASVRVFR